MKESPINCKKFGTVYMDENCKICDHKKSYDIRTKILNCDFIEVENEQ